MITNGAKNSHQKYRLMPVQSGSLAYRLNVQDLWSEVTARASDMCDVYPVIDDLVQGREAGPRVDAM